LEKENRKDWKSPNMLACADVALDAHPMARVFQSAAQLLGLPDGRVHGPAVFGFAQIKSSTLGVHPELQAFSGSEVIGRKGQLEDFAQAEFRVRGQTRLRVVRVGEDFAWLDPFDHLAMAIHPGFMVFDLGTAVSHLHGDLTGSEFMHGRTFDIVRNENSPLRKSGNLHWTMSPRRGVCQ
jgi:hypothetical protein